MDICQYLKIFWLAVIGAVVGSFVNCAASRLAAGQKPFAGRSCCTACGQQLAARDLIPIVSYVLKRGKCRFCASKIPGDCLAAELAGAVAFVCLGQHFGLCWELVQWLVAAALLLALALTDWHGRIIPDKILLLLLINRAIWFALLEIPLPGAQTLTEWLCNSLLSLLVPSILLAIVLLTEIFAERELMGGGDIKLLFVLALYLSWVQLVLLLFIACLLGLLLAVLGLALGQRSLAEPLPFGVDLALAALLTVCYGAPLVNWYLGLF